MNRTLRAAAGAALLACLVLTGCQPAEPGSTSTTEITCDSSGVGPLSGCGDAEVAEVLDDIPEDTSPQSAGTCDPSGVGPLSGCDNAATGQDTSPTLIPDDGVTQTDLALAARHEAGHKAVADEYGWSIRWARVWSDGSGRVWIWGFKWKDPQQQLVVYYAGVIACGDESTGYGYADSEGEYVKGDLDFAEEILDRYPPDEANRLEATARDQAAAIVAKRSAEIDRDAADLLDDGELS